jgi:hypothetical protein
MSGQGAEKRYHAACRRAAKLRRAGLTLSQVAENIGVPKSLIVERIKLGERLLSLKAMP